MVFYCLHPSQSNNQAPVFVSTPSPRGSNTPLIRNWKKLTILSLYTLQHAILEMNHPSWHESGSGFQGAGMPIRSTQNSLIIVGYTCRCEYVQYLNSYTHAYMYICDISHAFASFCCENYQILNVESTGTSCCCLYKKILHSWIQEGRTCSDSDHLLKSLQQTVEDDKANLLQCYPP